MIKRHTIYTHDGMPYMAQHEQGEYVRYIDHKCLLDAAHGALELQQGKTVDEHKAEFEDWYAENIASKIRAEYDDNYYRHKPEYAAWQAWKAAKGIKE